jgi:zinc/manganese transport system ATP-binding protein
VILSLENFTLFNPDARPLVHNLNIKIEAGKVLLVSGANGSGKTTLIHELIHRLHHHYHLQYVPQLANIACSFPLTLKDFLELSHPKLLLDQVRELGILEPEQLRLSWNTASGGERKRALITRALLFSSDVLVLDEPFNHLDQKSCSLLMNQLITAMKKPSLQSLILVAHQREWVKAVFAQHDIDILEVAL